METETWNPDDPWDPRNPENKYRTRVLRQEMRARLLVWDPIGVGGSPEAQDEYDCLISPLLQLLHDGASQDDLKVWLGEQLVDHFGLARDPEGTAALAGDLVPWWMRHTASGQG